VGQDYTIRLETSIVKAIELPEPKKDVEVMETYGEAKENISERETAKSIDILMLPIDSSNIKYAGYNKEFKQLRIQFTNGGIFQYKDIPDDIYNELKNAESYGSYFSKNIRNVFKCVKIN
jgi:hypothetical protein